MLAGTTRTGAARIVAFAIAAPAALALGAAAQSAQPTEDPFSAYRQMEQLSEPPRPSPRRGAAPSAAPRLAGFANVQVNVTRGGLNVLGDAANEPSIAVDPTNPDRMVIGWRQFDTILSNFRTAGFGFTRDGGRTWGSGVIDPGVFRSDPVLAVDVDGNFYYSSLTSDAVNLSCDFFLSSNGGASWFGPIDAWGGDKQWIAIDRTSGIGRGNAYQAWSTAGSCCGSNVFTRSTNGGINFMTPVWIPENPRWGSMDVGPDGTLWIAGISSTGGARMVVANSTTAQDPNVIPWFTTQQVPIGGIVRALQGVASPNPDGLLGQAWIAVDASGGPLNGNIYLCCSVDPPGTADPLDVMFARSRDNGVTWDEPIRINDDAPGAWNWNATMSVAPNGRIDIIWNDTRNTGVMNWSELHYASSADGGDTWTGNHRLSPAWDSWLGWPNQNKIGDYYHMVSDRVGANLAWAATFNGEQDIYFLRIGDTDCNGNGVGDAIDVAAGTAQDADHDGRLDECEVVLASESATPGLQWELLQNYPNPFNPQTAIRFESPGHQRVRLEILDVSGRMVRTLWTQASPGPNSVAWDGRDALGRDASSGVYVYRLTAPGFSAANRMVLVR